MVDTDILLKNTRGTYWYLYNFIAQILSYIFFESDTEDFSFIGRAEGGKYNFGKDTTTSLQSPLSNNQTKSSMFLHPW